MKLNWGHKLILVFILFASLMSFLVYQCMHTNYELVTKEYYKEELAYQQVIDGTNRANQLSAPVTISREQQELVIQLPVEMKQHTISGSVWLYCNATAARDKKFAIRSDRETVSLQALKSGNYKAKISWTADGIQYYSEQAVTIP